MYADRPIFFSGGTLNKVRLFGLLAALVLCLAFTACDGDQVVTHAKNTLGGSKATWQDIQDEVAKLYLGGKITEAQWTQFTEIDAKYRASHNAAVTALKIYEQTHDKPAERILFSALAELDSIIVSAAELLKAWKGGA